MSDPMAMSIPSLTATPKTNGHRPSLLSINNYHYPRGGADAMYLAHGARFETLGWQHAWFAMRHPRNLPTPWSSHFVDDIEFGHRYTPLELARKAAASIWSLQAQQRLRSVLAKSRPDIVHLHNIYHHLSPSILPVLQQAGVPSVITAHDFQIACPNYRMQTQGAVCPRCRDGAVCKALAPRLLRASVVSSALGALQDNVHPGTSSRHPTPVSIVSPGRSLL